MPGEPDQADTVLARRLNELGAVELPTLQRCLEQIRARRDQEPGLTLGLVLLREGLVDPEVLAQATPRPGSVSGSADIPERVGDYRVIRMIARGGMGAVYEVEHTPTGVRRALKTLLPGGLVAEFDDEERLRLREEALALGQLDHPAIVAVHGGDLDGNPPWLVQDLLPGGSLEARLKQGPLPLDEAVAIARDLADGLAHAHAQGVLHRDLKPDNVLFDARGAPCLVDFGLARRLDASLRLTVTGTILGTPGFMPPEQAKGQAADVRSDVYGLGALLYAMLTGKPPFTGSTPINVLAQVLEKDPQPPSSLRDEVPPALDAVVLRALAKEPEQRYPDVRAFAAALSGVTPGRRPSRLPLALTLAGLLLLGLSGAVIAVRTTREPADEPTSPPTQPLPGPTQAPPPELPGKVKYFSGWTLPAGTKLKTTVTADSRLRTQDLAPTNNRLTVVAETVVFSNEQDRIELRGEVTRIHGRIEVPSDIGGGTSVRFDSDRPPPPRTTAAMVAGRFLGLVGRTIIMHWSPTRRVVGVSGFPGRIWINNRMSLDLNDRFRRQLHLSAAFLPTRRSEAWDEPYPDYAEQLLNAGLEFKGEGVRHCRLATEARSLVLRYQLEIERWTQVPPGVTQLTHAMRGEVRMTDGYLAQSQVKIRMSWLLGGRTHRLEKSIDVRNDLR